MTQDYLTPKQVQAEFGISKASLYRWEEQGKLTPSRTPGNQRRYTRESIQSLLSQPVEKFTQQQPQEFATKPNNRDAYREFGSTSLSRWGGSVSGGTEALRELQGYQGRILYREMRKNDPVLDSVFFACIQSMRQAVTSYRVEPASDKEADKEAAEFVESCLDDMSFSWADTFDSIVQPLLEQGFALNEIVYKKRLGDAPPKYTDNPATSKFNDGKVGWRKWATRPPESLSPGNEWIFDEHGGVQGINQSPDPNTGKFVPPVPMEKLLHFRTTVYPANTPEPPPIHRAAYLPYYYTQNIQEIEGIGIERDLGGLPVMYLGKDRSMEGANSDYQMSVDLVTNIRVDEQSGVVLPGPKLGTAGDGEGFLLELLSSQNTRSHDIGKIIDRYDKRKALIVLAQFIMLGMESIGSFALSRHQGDLFSLAVTAWLDSIAGVINRHAIPRLIKMNSFPGITGMPKLVFSPVGVPDLKTIAEYIDKLVGREILTPSRELEEHLRMISDLPKIDDTVELRWKRKEEMAENPPVPPTTPPLPDNQEPDPPQLEKIAK